MKNKIPRTAIRGKCLRGAYKINQLHYITKERFCQMRIKEPEVYCADCAVELFLPTFDYPDDGDIADWERKEMMAWQ